MVRRKKELKPIEVVIMNPEALEFAEEKVTQYYYEKYLEMISKGLLVGESNKSTNMKGVD